VLKSYVLDIQNDLNAFVVNNVSGLKSSTSEAVLYPVEVSNAMKDTRRNFSGFISGTFQELFGNFSGFISI
jgi:hypothetical protein